ncbi:MAG: hypothetical protein QG623_65 [Patescibacteria group bacterium]|nr:hypothetical protein [Patescibacteria group bacterium]
MEQDVARVPLSRQSVLPKVDSAAPAITERYSALRSSICDVVLDDGLSFIDKINMLAATDIKTGLNHQNDRVTTALMRLCGIGKDPVMLRTTGGLVVGVLDEFEPWFFFDGACKGDTINPDLGVRFSSVFRVNNTESYLHESYGQSSPRDIIAPVVESIEPTIDDTQGSGLVSIAAGLPHNPYGPMHLLDKVLLLPDRISIGMPAIHKKVAQEEAQSTEKQSAMHAAVTEAFVKMASS